uniref:Uncharacterized protein n=1 Tax=Romanomermis culicivorax TaxID=13658 RepID=A0A915IGK1_ROMCU
MFRLDVQKDKTPVESLLIIEKVGPVRNCVLVYNHSHILRALAKRLPPASFWQDLDDESAMETMAEFWFISN